MKKKRGIVDADNVTPLRIDGRIVGFTHVYIPEGWGTPEFDAKFPPVIGESYLQRIRREYDPEDKAMPEWQPATSFPFLKIARDHGVSYRQIMEELEQVELSEFFAEVQGHRRNIEYSETLESPYRDRQRAIRAALLAERARREQVR